MSYKNLIYETDDKIGIIKFQPPAQRASLRAGRLSEPEAGPEGASGFRRAKVAPATQAGHYF
jgi:hypothetical protein